MGKYTDETRAFLERAGKKKDGKEARKVALMLDKSVQELAESLQTAALCGVMRTINGCRRGEPSGEDRNATAEEMTDVENTISEFVQFSDFIARRYGEAPIFDIKEKNRNSPRYRALAAKAAISFCGEIFAEETDRHLLKEGPLDGPKKPEQGTAPKNTK